MSKEKDLEKQLEDLRKAKEALLGPLDDCAKWPDARKAKVYDAVIPFVRQVVDLRIKGTSADSRESQQVIYDKLLRAVFGEQVFDHLSKL